MTKTKNVNLKKYLKDFFGFSAFKGQQEEIIKTLLEGKDVFVLMPTGGGKSLCYQLPALIQEGTAIVVSPLIALMKNQVDLIRGFSPEDGIAHFINSSLRKSEINKVKKDILAGKTKLLYLAPESLNKTENIEFLKDVNISFYAVDEAHCISEWGHDFRPEYRRIRPMIDSIKRAPIIALTATATPKVQHDILKNLDIDNAKIFKDSFNRPNLYYEVRLKNKPEKQIIKFIRENEGKSGIIYCMSRKKVEELAQKLQVNGIKAVPYHAGMDAKTRNENQDKFLMEEVDVIVATIAFGMGIDKPDIRFVIHYDMPRSLEGYYQETGRAGRDGGEGKCISFYKYDDMTKLEKFLQGKPVTEQEIGRQLISEVVAYAESAVCRRKQLLHYFGEEYNVDNCENCDNCLHPKKKFEGKEYISLVLKTVDITKEKFKTEYIAKLLAGETTNTMIQYKHHKLDMFGAGKEEGEKFWVDIIRQCLINKFLEKDIINYGILKITEKGREFLKKPYSVTLYEFHNYDEYEEEAEMVSGGTAAVDDVLFNMLKSLRKEVAQEHGVPPYIIFQDVSLEDMAIHYPITKNELEQLTGVGKGKAEKYGQKFIELITRYVEENEIERPQDFIVKSSVQKSAKKVEIIKSIDRKIPLEEIAESLGLDFFEMLEELESIINAGTKINLDYYINDVIDEEKQEELMDFLGEFEGGSLDEVLEAAYEEFGEDEYTEEEIRLMRIKFISDMGN